MSWSALLFWLFRPFNPFSQSVGVTLGVMLLMSSPLAAQQSSSILNGQLNGGRDCQVVRTCNFTKGGTFRGCLSSYTCRTCRLVASRCTVGSGRGTCQEMKCGWGA
jgi:hypothetical protein